MKKIFRYIALALVAAMPVMALSSCDPDPLDEVRTDSSKYVAPVVEPVQEIRIDKAAYDANKNVTFTWKAADFGASTSVLYTIVLKSSSKEQVLSADVTGTSFTIDSKTLYDRLTGSEYLGLQAGTETTISVYVSATVGLDFDVLKSEPVSVKCYCEDGLKN